MDITVDELYDVYNTSLREIGKKEGLIKFLNILSRNPELEFMDAMSIYCQYPEGKMLNTYQIWKKNFGRHVKSGETGIKTIEFSEEELVDENDEVYDIRKYPRIVSKYDISQTQGRTVSLLEEVTIKNEKELNVKKMISDYQEDKISLTSLEQKFEKSKSDYKKILAVKMNCEMIIDRKINSDYDREIENIKTKQIENLSKTKKEDREK